MSIKFDSQACVTALKQELIFDMIKLQKELLNEAKQNMLTPEGAESLYDEDIVDIANVIIASISGGAWAVMDEFGTGSYMDRKNPALDNYRKSKSWNPARDVATILSRPDQPGQVDIFGNSVNGRGKGGVDLEKIGVVEAMPPSHSIETATRWMANGRFKFVIKTTLATFNYGKYLKTDKR